RSSRSVANAAAAAQTAAAPAKYPSPIPSATAGQPSIILPVTATPRYDASAPSTGAAGIERHDPTDSSRVSRGDARRTQQLRRRPRENQCRRNKTERHSGEARRNRPMRKQRSANAPQRGERDGNWQREFQSPQHGFNAGGMARAR